MATDMQPFARSVFFFLLVSLSASGQVKVARDADRIIVDVQGKPFTAVRCKIKREFCAALFANDA